VNTRIVEVAESLRIGLGTVPVVLEKAKHAGLDWPTVQTLTDETLEARLYRRPSGAVPESALRPWPDCAYIHRERRKPGVTLEICYRVSTGELAPTPYSWTRSRRRQPRVFSELDCGVFARVGLKSAHNPKAALGAR
jgi:hypothetical protein